VAKWSIQSEGCLGFEVWEAQFGLHHGVYCVFDIQSVQMDVYNNYKSLYLCFDIWHFQFKSLLHRRSCKMVMHLCMVLYLSIINFTHENDLQMKDVGCWIFNWILFVLSCNILEHILYSKKKIQDHIYSPHHTFKCWIPLHDYA